MSEWTARRFWKDVMIEPADRGWQVCLDGRPVKTPAKRALILPTRALAEAVAAEWRAVDDRIDPAAMPFTRSANSAIDKVAPQRDAVVLLISAYGETDLLCYRAEAPEELAALQERAWGPMLSWAADRLGAPLVVTRGVVPIPQPAASLDALAARVGAMTVFELTALHDLVAMTGSLVLGLAVAIGGFAPEKIWADAQVDDEWQIARWGTDEEAVAVIAARKTAFLDADRFWQAAKTPDAQVPGARQNG